MNTEPETPLPECHEGPDAFARFDSLVTDVLAVPHSLIERRQRAYRKKVEANPNRRGPKPKVTPSDTSDYAAES